MHLSKNQYNSLLFKPIVLGRDLEMIHLFKNRTPKISEKAFVADSAQVIGNVTIGESIVMFNAVIRGND